RAGKAAATVGAIWVGRERAVVRRTIVAGRTAARRLFAGAGVGHDHLPAGARVGRSVAAPGPGPASASVARRNGAIAAVRGVRAQAKDRNRLHGLTGAVADRRRDRNQA